MRKQTWTLIIALAVITMVAGRAMSVPRGAKAPAVAPPDTVKQQRPQVIIDQEEIPDSLLHPRWRIQRTIPVTLEDLNQIPADLQRPDNLKQDVVYNDTLNMYIIGNKIGGAADVTSTSTSKRRMKRW